MMPKMLLIIPEKARSDWKSAAMPYVSNDKSTV